MAKTKRNSKEARANKLFAQWFWSISLFFFCAFSVSCGLALFVLHYYWLKVVIYWGLLGLTALTLGIIGGLVVAEYNS